MKRILLSKKMLLLKRTKEYRKRMVLAQRIVRTTKKTYTSYIQRKMQIGYNYADMLMEDISKLSGFKFVYKYRQKLLSDQSIRKKPRSR